MAANELCAPYHGDLSNQAAKIIGCSLQASIAVGSE